MPDGPVGIITDIRKFSTHDGPGIRTTVFFKGCPLRCKWCSNPETLKVYPELYFIKKRCMNCGACIEVCPEKAIYQEDGTTVIDRNLCNRCMKCIDVCPNDALKKIGREVTVEQVMAECIKDMPFYGEEGGVTLSGGEPLYQPQFALAILQACKEKKLSTVLDTCGFGAPGVVEEILPFVDMVLLDIKHMDSQKHLEATGVPNNVILHNAMLMANRVRIRVSLPLIPGFNNLKDNLEETAKFSKSIGAEMVDINPIHALGTQKYEYLGLTSPYGGFKKITPKDIERAKNIFQAYGLGVTIGRMM